MEADLLALDFAGITGHETGLAQLGLEGGIVIDQGTGNAMTHSTRLTRLTATSHIDHDVKGLGVVSQHQGLLANHDGGLTTEKFLDVFTVHHNLAGAFF